ncbi:MAG: uncharacterized protein K0S76_2150 [Herbinix sp.]|jgi:flavodoxin|nr:uncharacterized protein [Herbinix sp.]
MKTKIIYATMTKHSKKIAEAISKELNVPAENVKSNPATGELDLLFIVGGIYGGESLPEMLTFVKGLNNKVKKAVLVTTCASKKNGQNSVRQLLKERGIEVVDEFIGRGGFLFMHLGHPNKNEIQDAVDFAKKQIR